MRRRSVALPNLTAAREKSRGRLDGYQDVRTSTCIRQPKYYLASAGVAEHHSESAIKRRWRTVIRTSESRRSEDESLRLSPER